MFSFGFKNDNDENRLQQLPSYTQNNFRHQSNFNRKKLKRLIN